MLECPKCRVISRPKVERPKICWACGYRYKEGDFGEEKAAEANPPQPSSEVRPVPAGRPPNE